MQEDRTAIGSDTTSDVDVHAGEKVRLKPPKEPSPNLSMHGGAASSDGLGARLGLRLGKGSSRAHRLGASSSSGGSSSGAAKGEDSASTESRPGGHRASPPSGRGRVGGAGADLARVEADLATGRGRAGLLTAGGRPFVGTPTHSVH